MFSGFLYMADGQLTLSDILLTDIQDLIIMLYLINIYNNGDDLMICI